jgi:iron-sulfur cluster repair protein YtfE (RIC family)
MIHKSIRCALGETLIRMGQTSFDDAAVAAQMVDMLEEVLGFCEHHLEHEERFVRPMCEGKISLRPFDAGHPEHTRFIAELRALASSVTSASPERRSEAGHSLYLHFAAFVGDALLHMAEEERVLLPLLQRTFSDAELLGIQKRIQESMSPADLAVSARRMLRAASRVERIGLVHMMLARAPRKMVRTLLDSTRATLPPEVYAELTAVIDSAKGVEVAS